MIVGGAKPDSWVSTWAPTAWPESLIPSIAARIVVKPLHRIDDADRQRRPHGGHPVAQRALLDVGPHRHRDHRLQHDVLGRLPVEAHVASERARDHGEDDVVDRTAERVLDRFELGQVAVTQVNRRCGPIRVLNGLERGRLQPGPGTRRDPRARRRCVRPAGAGPRSA